MGFEREPRRYSVSAVAGTEFSRSAMPKPCDHANAPFWTTATETPGTLPAAMNLETALSIVACVSGENVLAGPAAQPRTATPASRKSIAAIRRRTLPETPQVGVCAMLSIRRDTDNARQKLRLMLACGNGAGRSNDSLPGSRTFG